MPGHEDAQKKPAVAAVAPPEVDDFGLPIRKARKVITADTDSDSDGYVSASQEAGEKEEKLKTANKESTQAVHAPPTKDDETSVSAQNDPSPRKEEEKPKEEVKNDPPPQADTKSPEKKESDTAAATPPYSATATPGTIQEPSEFSYQAIVGKGKKKEPAVVDEGEWQEMPAYAPFDIYNDDGKLVAKEVVEESDDEQAAYGHLGGAGKGYTRVQDDDDAQSATSMDDNTAYLFKGKGTNVQDEYEEYRDPLSQMQTTKNLLTEGQRIAYVGIVRLAMVQMVREAEKQERTRSIKKHIDLHVESLKMWSQKMMIRLYSHMDIEPAGMQPNATCASSKR